MSEYLLLPEAEADLHEIVEYIGREGGRGPAARIHSELLRAARELAAYPGTGRSRVDLTARAVRVRLVYPYLIVYRPGTDPLEIVGFLHGARDPSKLRDRIGEPVAQYSVFC